MSKVRKFDFSFILPFPPQQVWSLVADSYGNVAAYSNGLVASSYVGSLKKGAENCQRRCDLDAKGNSYLIEKMVDVDAKNMVFTNVITEAKGLPIVPYKSKTIFQLSPVLGDKCKMSIEVYFCTKPSFLSMLMKGVSRKQMSALAIGVEHYLETGQTVTKDNFSEISKRIRAVAG